MKKQIKNKKGRNNAVLKYVPTTFKKRFTYFQKDQLKRDEKPAQ